MFGGSHNAYMMLSNGGSLYIDNGKPTKSGFKHTVQNIINKPGTLSFNVPVGFAMLVHEMETNLDLRQAYFRDLDLIFYAGASLPQDVWTRLEEMAMEVRGPLAADDFQLGDDRNRPRDCDGARTHRPLWRDRCAAARYDH